VKWNLLIGLVILASCCFAPADASAARPKRVQATTPDSEYRNKPIAIDSTVWYCAYDGNQAISCRLGAPGESTKLIQEQIDPRLPALAHGIRNHPGQLAGKTISIPLHTVPFDFDMVGQLAEAVMCGNHNTCAVIFARNMVALAPLVRSFEQQRLARRDSLAVGPLAAAN
jgi:hypothetical protein